MRDSDREQTWVEIEIVTEPTDPGPIGLELRADRDGSHWADLSRITIDEQGRRHYWRRVA